MLQSSSQSFHRTRACFALRHQSQRRSHHQWVHGGGTRRDKKLSLMPLLLLMISLTLLETPSSAAFVVPNEVPSILSLVYSNIPPIKKGTDSRLGFGFRLGEHADFQILVELGPQKETRPIGDQDKSDGSSFNKRQVNKSQQTAVLRDVAKTEKPQSTWLEKWSSYTNISAKKKVSNKDIASKKPVVHKSTELAQLVPSQQPLASNQAMQQLQLLYKLATTTEESATRKEKIPLATDKAAFHLHERLKVLKAPAISDGDLQGLQHKTRDQSKAEVTKELMDVNLDD